MEGGKQLSAIALPAISIVVAAAVAAVIHVAKAIRFPPLVLSCYNHTPQRRFSGVLSAPYQGQVASGGIDISTASILCPVSSPNFVPRS